VTLGVAAPVVVGSSQIDPTAFHRSTQAWWWSAAAAALTSALACLFLPRHNDRALAHTTAPAAAADRAVPAKQ
jgi:hypothetical protein